MVIAITRFKEVMKHKTHFQENHFSPFQRPSSSRVKMKRRKPHLPNPSFPHQLLINTLQLSFISGGRGCLLPDSAAAGITCQRSSSPVFPLSL